MSKLKGDLEARLSKSLGQQPFDRRLGSKPHGLLFVDFIVDRDSEVFLIEVKDPCSGDIPAIMKQERHNDFVERLRGRKLIDENLVPKCRDTYLFLHLMKQDAKPMKFLVLLGLECGNFDPALIGVFQTRLMNRLRKESESPWKRQYVAGCAVFTESSWNSYFPEHLL